MIDSKRIEIFGIIASGKTTLTELLAEAMDCRVSREKFAENPFFKLFYKSPEMYAYEKNVCFLAQHVGEVKAVDGRPWTICDYATFQDLAYASLRKDEEHLAYMNAMFRHLTREIGAPRFMIHLLCDEEVALERIRGRGRAEEAGITNEYLRSLDRAIHSLVKEHSAGSTLITMRSDEADFAPDGAERQAVSDELLAQMGLRAPASAGVSP
jgi:deoxyadenosine/deoxycytidine kinase